MHSRGIKRKLCAGGVSASAASYTPSSDSEEPRAPPPPPPPSFYGGAVQRRALLDMSLVKLQHCHTLAEPDLCRSVLIANTVRQIQEEMMMTHAMVAHHDHHHDHGSCQVVPDPFMVSCDPESPRQTLPDSHAPSCPSGTAPCQNNSDALSLCPSGGDMSCRPCGSASDRNLATYDLCPEESSSSEESYCWGRAELKMMGHALLEEEEAESSTMMMMRPPRCILGRQEEEDLEDDDVFLGKLEMRTGAVAVNGSSPSSSGGGGLEEFLSDVEASYYDLDTMAIGTATPTTLTELDHIMEIIVGGS